MRALVVSKLYPPMLDAEAFVAGKFTAALVEAGVDVETICGSPRRGTDASALWDEVLPRPHLASDGRQVLGSGIASLLDRGYVRDLWDGLDLALWSRDVRRLSAELARTAKFDFVMTRSLPYESCFVGHALSQTLGVPWIASLNDPPQLMLPPPYEHRFVPARRLLQGPKYRALGRVLRRCDLYVFPSMRLGRYVGRCLGIPAEEKGIALPHIGWQTPNPTVRSGVRPRRVTLLHTGNMWRRTSTPLLRALNHVLESPACRDLDVEISLVGTREAQDLVAGAHGMALAQAVKTAPSVPYEESLRLIDEASALLLLEAEMAEGVFLPSKLADYAASGRPVLMYCPPQGAVADLVGGDRHPGFMGQDEAQACAVLTAFFEDYRSGADLGKYRVDWEPFRPQTVARRFLAEVHRLGAPGGG